MRWLEISSVPVYFVYGPFNSQMRQRFSHVYPRSISRSHSHCVSSRFCGNLFFSYIIEIVFINCHMLFSLLSSSIIRKVYSQILDFFLYLRKKGYDVKGY